MDKEAEKKKQEKLRHLSRAMRYSDLTKKDLEDLISYAKKWYVNEEYKVLIEKWLGDTIKHTDEIISSLALEYASEVDFTREEEEKVREAEHEKTLEKAGEYSRQAKTVTLAIAVLTVVHVAIAAVNIALFFKR